MASSIPRRTTGGTRRTQSCSSKVHDDDDDELFVSPTSSEWDQETQRRSSLTSSMVYHAPHSDGQQYHASGSSLSSPLSDTTTGINNMLPFQHHSTLRRRSPRAPDASSAQQHSQGRRQSSVYEDEKNSHGRVVRISEPPQHARFPFYTSHYDFQQEQEPPQAQPQQATQPQQAQGQLSLQQAARRVIFAQQEQEHQSNRRRSSSAGSMDGSRRRQQDTLVEEEVFPSGGEEETKEQLEVTTTNVSKQDVADSNLRTNHVALEDNEEYYTPTTTPLHEICRNSQTVEELLQEAPAHLTVQAASESDENGQTPFHVLANNHALSLSLVQQQQEQHDLGRTATPSFESHATFSSSLSSPTNKNEQDLIHFCVDQLLTAYPAAMLTCDAQGTIPLEGALIQWVNEAHGCSSSGARHGGGDEASSLPTGRGSATAVRLQSFLKKSTKSLTSSLGSRFASVKLSDHGPNDANGASPPALPREEDVEAASRRLASPRARLMRPPHARDRIFPRTVELTAHAHFALTLLSAILDHLGRLHTTRPLKRKMSLVTTNNQDGDEGDSFHTALQELKNMTAQDICTEIVQSIASIPDLLKTILLMHDDDQRHFVLSTTIIQRVLESKYSVGLWLTGMLQSDEKRVWERAIVYLKLASEPSRMEPSGSSSSSSSDRWNPTRSTQDATKRQDKEELYEEVSRLQDFVPSLLSLGEKQVEEAATTELVRRVLDRIISRPFAVTVVFCDALFLAILIFGFRSAVNRLLLGDSPSKVLLFIYICNIGIFYFIIRELGKAVSLCMITRQARIYYWSFWNLTDLTATVLALVSTLAIRTKFRSDETDVADFDSLRPLLAITTGFLWLRVLSYLKGINMQLATFVLAILQITRDVLWFCVILLTLVLAFAQMMFTLLVPTACATDQEAATDSYACQPREYLLRVYAILLGDFGTFEREDLATAFSVFLIVVYSFIVVLVLLNVLIAVASDSYEKCLVRSQNLFGRARVMLIAELVSFQNLLRRHRLPHDTMDPSPRIYKTWWSHDSSWGWSRGSIVFFSLSSLVVLIWVIGEMAGYAAGAQYGNIFLSLGSVFIIVLLFIGIMLFLSTGAADVGTSRHNVIKGEDDNGRVQHFGAWYKRSIQHAMLRLLGSSRETTANAFTGDGWRGRLVFMQQEMTHLLEDTKKDSKEKAQKTQNAISQTETRLRLEVTNIEDGVNDLRSELQEALQTVNARLSRDDELRDDLAELLETLRKQR